MSQSAISNRLTSLNGFKGKELDLHAKLSIQAKQNALPKVTFGPAKQEIAADLEKLRSKYTVLKPKKQLVSASLNITPKKETPKESVKSPTKDGIPDPKRNIYPLEKISNRFRDGARLLSGLMNMGNTCFLNASLQCLLHTPALYNVLVTMGKSHRQDGKFDAMSALQSILRQSQNHGPSHAIRPNEVVFNMRKIGGHFCHGRQECAHEFTRLFMDAMLRSSSQGHGKLDKYEETTTIPHRIFGGWFRSRVTCMACRHNSDTYESFLDMPLEIKGCENLYHCFQKFTREERLDESNKYKCEKCRQMTNAKKQFTVHRAPNVLAICLKRFSMMGTKLSYDIKYPEKLKINRYCSNPKVPHEYELYAILVHSGMSVNSGHYFSFCKTSRGTWAKFDDCTVTPMQIEHVLKRQPYLLYYRRVSPNPLSGHSSVGSISVPRSISPHHQNQQRSKTPSPKPSPKQQQKPLLEPSRIVIGPKRPSPTPLIKSPSFGEKRRSIDNGGKQLFSNSNKSPSQKWKPFSNKKSSNFISTSPMSQNQVKRTISVSSTLQHLKKERTLEKTSTPEKSRKIAILAGGTQSEALARISNYSSDEEQTQEKTQVKNGSPAGQKSPSATGTKFDKEDDLMVSYKKRQEQKRKRKYNSEGSFWGLGKAPKWEGKENDIDKKDRDLSKSAKSSIIPKDQLEIDQGKVKKVKSEEKMGHKNGFGKFNPFQREQAKMYRNSK